MILFLNLALGLAMLATACTCQSSVYQDVKMDRYIDGLMSKLTLEQKIGQLNLHSTPGFISAERVMDEDENAVLLNKGLLGGLYGGPNPKLLR